VPGLGTHPAATLAALTTGLRLADAAQCVASRARFTAHTWLSFAGVAASAVRHAAERPHLHRGAEPCIQATLDRVPRLLFGLAAPTKYRQILITQWLAAQWPCVSQFHKVKVSFTPPLS